MKMNDINKEYTKKVAEYISQGYTIHTQTMSGHQGEIAKIDLTDGKDVIRVYMTNETHRDIKHIGMECVVIRVGRHMKETRSDTIWMKDLEILEERTYWRINHYGDWYVESFEEALAADDLRFSRYCNRRARNYNGDVTTDITTDKSREIAKRYLKRVYGYQRVSDNQIEIKKVQTWDDTVKYAITHKRQSSTLH